MVGQGALGGGGEEKSLEKVNAFMKKSLEKVYICLW